MKVPFVAFPHTTSHCAYNRRFVTGDDGFLYVELQDASINDELPSPLDYTLKSQMEAGIPLNEVPTPVIDNLH